ncbi:MAG: Kiwa anti-phage protein KwaB-like domain-containing protein [Candidatus Saccharimonadales bacterium]
MEETKTETTDIFLWANQTDAVKNELTLELFVFSKNYTPYAMRLSKGLDAQARAMFIYDLVNTVNFGAGTGMSVRDFELSEAEENVLLRTDLEKVGKAETLIHLIEKQRGDIVQFSETEHEFKRIKGVVLKATRPDGKYFYVAKAVQQSSVLPGAVSWQLSGDTFAPFEPEVGVKLPSDNQVLIIDKDIFVFSQSKFEKLFQYEYKKQLLAEQKVEEILKTYQLSLPDEMDLQTLVREKPGVVNKLQKLEIGAITQEQAVEYADAMQLDLMTDDDGKIIIMDGRDLDMFVNLINEDYITSEITGRRYVIKSKKLLDEPEGEPPRG